MMTLTNPKDLSKEVESAFDNSAQAIAYIKANLSKVTEKSKSFASDMCDKRADKLSDSQRYWIHKIAMDIMNPPAPNAPPAPAKGTKSVGDFNKVIAMVKHAFDGGAKRLKIRLLLPDGRKVSLAPYAPDGKFVAVYVNDPDDHYNNYGRILPNGDFQPPRGVGKIDPSVFDIVLRFANDPLGVAKEYGQAIGECCFCSRVLTVGRSVELGYGPVCAERMGLESPY